MTTKQIVSRKNGKDIVDGEKASVASNNEEEVLWKEFNSEEVEDIIKSDRAAASEQERWDQKSEEEKQQELEEYAEKLVPYIEEMEEHAERFSKQNKHLPEHLYVGPDGQIHLDESSLEEQENIEGESEC